MPHAVLLQYTPAFSTHARQRPRRRGSLQVATAAIPALTTLWRGLFADARNAIRVDALAQALDVHALEGRSYVAQVWEQTVEQPARVLLPALAETILRDARDDEHTGTAALLPVALLAGRAAPGSAVEQYIGREVRDITQTSLRAVHRVIRTGMQEQQSLTAIARTVKQVIGLSPQQQRTLETLQQAARTAGTRASNIARMLDHAARQGVQKRAETVARTEAVRMTQLGAHQVWETAVQQGAVAAEQVRRYWQLGPNPCADFCVPIPGMNPDGVGLYEAFQTPEGGVLFPPMHVNCMCSVTTRLRG
jgi:hypothetical protein